MSMIRFLKKKNDTSNRDDVVKKCSISTFQRIRYNIYGIKREKLVLVFTEQKYIVAKPEENLPLCERLK